MVLIDGAPEKCCTKPVWSVVGKAVTTVEGPRQRDRPHPLQQAFIDEQAGQCGYCLAGILISAKALLDKNQSRAARRSRRRSTGISAGAARTTASCVRSKRRSRHARGAHP